MKASPILHMFPNPGLLPDPQSPGWERRAGQKAGTPLPPLCTGPAQPLKGTCMQIVGVSLLSLGALGLLLLAGHVAWQQIQTLRYLNQLDEWAEDIPEWH